MSLGVIGYLVAHAGAQRKLSPVFEFGIKRAFDTKQDVPLHAPMGLRRNFPWRNAAPHLLSVKTLKLKWLTAVMSL